MGIGKGRKDLNGVEESLLMLRGPQQGGIWRFRKGGESHLHRKKQGATGGGRKPDVSWAGKGRCVMSKRADCLRLKCPQPESRKKKEFGPGGGTVGDCDASI